jgi:hypothetical protein
MMMKFTTIILCLYFIATAVVTAQLSKFHWAKNMGGSLKDEGNSLAMDSSGNVYVTGWFQGKAFFGEGTKTISLISSGESDIFTAKYDNTGNLLWVKQMRGDLNEGGYAIALDKSNNVYTAGFFRGTVDFNPDSGIYELTSSGDFDIFITKLDSSGNFIWAKRMGGNSIEQLSSLVIDLSGYLYVGGYFSDTADFDPSDLSFNLTAAGTDHSYDAFIAKLDVSGNFIWAKQMGGNSQDLLHALAIDTIGNIYSTGSFIGRSDFDPGRDTFILHSELNRDIFVSKLDSSGNLIWVQQLGGTSRDIGYSIEVDFAGNVYTAGSFEGTADFNPGPNISNITSYGLADIFICKLDNDGNFLWVKQLGGDSADAVVAMTFDSLGNIYTTGWFSKSSDFDPGLQSYILTSAGQRDIFISKLDSSGNFAWAERMGGPYDDMGIDVSVDPNGSIYSIGYFAGMSDFSLDNTFTFQLTSSGSHDIFIKKFNPLVIVPQESIFLTYPNPCGNFFSLDLTKTITQGRLRIFDLLGQLVLELSEVSGDSFTIDIGSRPAGIYFIEIHENEMSYRSILVKN